MGTIKIVADSVCDLPIDIIRDYDIDIVPLTVNFEDHSYKDGVDLSCREFFNKLKNSKNTPTTSQVSPGEFIACFEKYKNHDTIIVFTISSKLSGTYFSALLAKDSFEAGNVIVIDSLGITLGYGLVVYEAAKMAKEGKSKEQIISRIEQMKNKVKYIFVVDTLEYLRKGGRLSMTKAVLGTVLNIKPVLTMEDGKLVTFDKIRTKRRVIPWIIDYMKDLNMDFSLKTLGVNHADDLESAMELIKEIRINFNPKEIVLSETGATVGVHSGPGAVAVYFEME